jgi:hypothetical protein
MEPHDIRLLSGDQSIRLEDEGFRFGLAEGLYHGNKGLQELVSRISVDASQMMRILEVMKVDNPYLDKVKADAQRLDKLLGEYSIEAIKSTGTPLRPNDEGYRHWYQGRQRGLTEANQITERQYQDLMHDVRNPAISCGGLSKRILKSADEGAKKALTEVNGHIANIEDACMRFSYRNLSPSEFDLVDHLLDTYHNYTEQVPGAPTLSVDQSCYFVYHDPEKVAIIWRNIFNYIALRNGHTVTRVTFQESCNRVESIFSCQFPVDYPLRKSQPEQRRDCGYQTLESTFDAIKRVRGRFDVKSNGEGAAMTVGLPYRINQ